jgi:hypothetical protein
MEDLEGRGGVEGPWPILFLLKIERLHSSSIYVLGDLASK